MQDNVVLFVFEMIKRITCFSRFDLCHTSYIPKFKNSLHMHIYIILGEQDDAK